MTTLAFDVLGVPGAQGSKRYVGHGVMVESSKKVKPWRSDVKAAAEAAIAEAVGWEPITVAAQVQVTFVFARPRGHYGTGRNADTLKPGAPDFVTSRAAGDVDKLLRSSFDALVAAGVLADDSLVVVVGAVKVYADPGESVGARFYISPVVRLAA